VHVGCRDRKRRRGTNPMGGAAPERGRSDPVWSNSGEGTRSGEFEAGDINLTGGSMFGRDREDRLRARSGRGRGTNDPRAGQAKDSEGQSNLKRGALEAREGHGGAGAGRNSEGGDAALRPACLCCRPPLESAACRHADLTRISTHIGANRPQLARCSGNGIEFAYILRRVRRAQRTCFS